MLRKRVLRGVRRAVRLVQGAGERLVRLAGPAFVCLAVVLISFVAVVHFTTLMPYAHGPGPSPDSQIQDRNIRWWIFLAADTAISVYVTYCILYNYVMAVVVSPGDCPRLLPPRNVSPEEYGSLASSSADAAASAPAAPGGQVALASCAADPQDCCRKCGALRCARAHHCRVCGKCVLRMDHHCSERIPFGIQGGIGI
eukprot:m51a1_g13115 hypothetical protein (198) ;mRNA; f:3150-3743